MQGSFKPPAGEEARRALVAAVGDTVDVDSYGVAMECQGFVNGFRLAMGVCGYSY